MATASTKPVEQNTELATFWVAECLLAVPIEQVQEINRNLTVTPVPHAPQHVRGVINLRGEVATVIDLRILLGIGDANQATLNRILIVRNEGESIGFCVDKVDDIISTRSGDFQPPPTNLNSLAGKYLTEVFRTEQHMIGVLDIHEVLN